MGWGNWAAALNPVGVIGSALSVGGELVGSYFDQQENNANRSANDRANQLNYDMQKEFAQNGIRWKVADAMAAGIHPLAALGAQGYSASPSHVGYQSNSGKGATSRSIAANLGQNISRSVMATQTQDERIATRLTQERMSLENDLLRWQIVGAKRETMGPPMPSMVNPNFGFNGVDPEGSVLGGYGRNRPPHPHKRSQTWGYTPDVEFSHTARGVAPVIPQQLSESYESDPIGSAVWRWRNTILPNFGDTDTKPPLSDLPRGYGDWRYSRMRQQWVPVFTPDIRQGYQYKNYRWR